MVEKELTYGEKMKELGHHSAALINLHLKHPGDWDATAVMNKLVKEYNNLNLDEEED